MSSTFGGLSTALNALMAQRTELTTTGQNIANVGTPGYTRQRAELQAASGASTAGLMRGTFTEQTGSGVNVLSIKRLSDAFVDARQRDAHASTAGSQATVQAYDQVESIVGEPSDTGLSSQLTQFWTSFQTLAVSPNSVGARQAVLSKAQAIVDTVQHGRSAVDSAYTDTRTQLDALVAQVNTTATGVADLNDKIRVAQAGGAQPNELMDRRDQLVLQMSELTGARSTSNADGTVNVSVQGMAIVSGTHATALSVSGGTSIDTSTATPLQLTFANGGTAGITGGQLGGVVDSLRSVYPDAAAGYDAVASSLATSVNALHSTAQDLDGNPTGNLFAGTTAKTLSLVVTDPRKLGAAAATGTGATFDGSIADAIAALRTSSSGADTRWSAVVAATGVNSAAAQNRATVNTSISTQADAARDSASSVSIDEEMTNMLTYQRAYEGAGRLMTTIDSMLDTLINRTGQVGR
jgi:flagellar hook-associated protein 1 FlgK